MDEKLINEVNDMVDKMEEGKITKREFFRYLAGLGLLLSGVAPYIRASSRVLKAQATEDLVRTGVLLRVREQHGAVGGVLQGRVTPGAVGYTQVDTRGAWNFSIAEGQAQMKIGRERAQFKAGEKVSVNAGDGISFLNDGVRPWFFEATYWPNWHPDAIYYEYAGQQVPGREAWFELKTHEEDTVERPMYHVYGWKTTPLNAGYKKQVEILKAKGVAVSPRPAQETLVQDDYSGYCCGVEVCDYSYANAEYVASQRRIFSTQDVARMKSGNTSRRDLFSYNRKISYQAKERANYTFAEYNDLDYRVITALSGEGTVEINGVPHRLRRGDSVTIAPGDRQKILNNTTFKFLVELRALNPTYWHPDHSFVELTKGKFVPGHEVWFELVLPL
jgi:mannose-6-phosphate isomerase-like protein (cupin superfamily)